MRKIQSRVDVARSKRINQIVVGGVLIFLMVVSTLGYSLMDNDSGDSGRVSEFGVDFVREGGFWKTQIEGEVFGFQYLPSEVGDVLISGDFDFGDYAGEVLYFVNVNEGASEVLNSLGRYVLRYQDACLNGSVCEGDLPVKSCDDNLIIFETGNETAVWRDDGCVYIVGDSVRGADAFLYKALKIS